MRCLLMGSNCLCRRVQVLSWSPRAFVYHNFLTDAEAAHIIKLAAPQVGGLQLYSLNLRWTQHGIEWAKWPHMQMKRSRVVGQKDDGDVSDIRTSAGTFLL